MNVTDRSSLPLTQTTPGSPDTGARDGDAKPRGDYRSAFLRRLERSAGKSGAPATAPGGGDGNQPVWDDARRAALFRQIELIVSARRPNETLAILHVGCGDGSLLAALGERFPTSELYGVDWPDRAGPASARAEARGVQLYGVDLDELFQTPTETRKERFDLAILESGFTAPAGAESALAPQWADGWVGKYLRHAIGVADAARLRQLRERGATAALEPPRSDGQLVCWSESWHVPGARGRWPQRLDRFLSFPSWFWQNARRHGLRDALYYGGHVLLAVADGRLPRRALSDADLRTRFCAGLRPTRRVRDNTLYVFVFLGEFGYEVLNWQGVVRKFARRLPASSAIAIGGRKGLQPFYESAEQYVEIDDVPEYRSSWAASYFAMAPHESRRHRPPTQKQFEYGRGVRGAIEAHVRPRLETGGRHVEFVFSSQLNAIEDCVFGVDPRFYSLPGYHGSIYRNLELGNNEYRRIEADPEVRAELEAKLGFSLDEPYVFVQSRRRSVGPQSGGELDAGPLVTELARRRRVVYLSFSTNRHLDSGSEGEYEGVTHYEAASFREQSCLIAHASRCIMLTEGDLGSHTYLPPLLGKDAVVVASEAVFARRSSPVHFWNRNVFRFGGRLTPLPAERLDSPAAVSAAADDILGAGTGPASPPEAPTKRILFVIRHAGYVRNCEHVIERLAEEGHAIHIAVGMTSKKSHDADVLSRLAARWPEVTYGQMPVASVRPWDDATGLSRVIIDYLRYLEPEYADATRLRARAQRWVPVRLVRLFEGSSLLRRRRVLRTVHACLRSIDRVAPTHLEHENFIQKHRPDLVVFTPLLGYVSDSLDYLKAARRLGIPTALCVASWDNLSNKGLVQLVPDRVILWNRVQEEEAIRMHAIPKERITVTGAHLFDHWFEMRPATTREEFCRQRGFDPDLPFLLYVCSSWFIAENEVPFVKRWIEAIQSSDSPLAGWGILVRPHPANHTGWQGVDLCEYENVVVWPPLGEGPVDDRSKQNYFDSLYHAAGIVGINTSALIEGGIVGTPTFTVVEDEFRETQVGTIHFHYLVRGGLVAAGEGLEDHVAQLHRVLVEGDPERERARETFVRDFIRPHGLDAPAAPFAVEALHSLLEGERPARPQSDVGPLRTATRLAFLPLGAVLHLYVDRHRRRGIHDHANAEGAGMIHRRRVKRDSVRPPRRPLPLRVAGGIRRRLRAHRLSGSLRGESS